MDVQKDNFWEELAGIIRLIAESDFVAIDLEMSGIQPANGPRHTAKPTSPKAIYEESKEVAQTFQIIQLGLTCVASDEQTSRPSIKVLY